MQRVVRYGLAAALLLAPALLAAQSAVGFRGGLRLADVQTTQDTEGVERFVTGGYFGIGLSDRVALQFEAVYGRRGVEGLGIGEDELDPGEPPASLNMQYLDFPVLLRTGFPGQRFLPSLFVGPYLSFMLGCELTVNGEPRPCAAETAPRFHPRATDYGLLAGGGLDMAMGESTLFIDLRYSQSLLSIQGGSGSMDARHAGLEITAGFAFPVGR